MRRRLLLRVLGAAAAAALAASTGCGEGGAPEPRPPRPASAREVRPVEADPFARARGEMVAGQIEARGVRDPLVLEALRAVPRHRFVAAKLASQAYEDRPLPIGLGQTISQPYIVGLMTELARPRRGGRALDVGTGSGYQAAVLAQLGMEVYGVEILCPLADEARMRLASLGYTGVEVRCGDGYGGWAEHAPFDCILVAAAAPRVPEPLLEQLAPGGRLVIPVGEEHQRLRVYEKSDAGGVLHFDAESVVFVPMTGRVREGP